MSRPVRTQPACTSATWWSVAVLVTLIALAPIATAGTARSGVEVLIRGAPIHGANGLAVNADGSLLVASIFGRDISVMDPADGGILRRYGADLGVDGPDDVAVGSDGSIYWTDLALGEVGRLEPDGTVTTQAVAQGVNPIAFSQDGRLFVGLAFFGDGLFELDPNLVLPPQAVIADSGTPPFLGQLNGFDFGPDGLLYAPQPFLGTIVRVDVDTGAMEVVTDAFAGLFPTSVEFDSRGRLFASIGEGEVVRVRMNGTYEVVSELPSGLDNMAFDADDRLFVSNSDDGAVYEVLPGGGFRTLSRGGLILPGGVALVPAVGGGRSLFVGDVFKLAEFAPRTGRPRDADPSSFAGGLTEPWTAARLGKNLVITSWMSNMVQVFDPGSDAVVEAYPDFALPMNAIGFEGDLVVAELGTGNVVRQAADGTRSTIASGLYVPTGLAKKAGDLWVADWATGMVWQIVDDGAALSPAVPVVSDLVAPEGLAAERDGSLLVVESGVGRLTRIDPATGAVTTVAEGLALGAAGWAIAPPTWAFNGVAVRRSGTIYVTGDVANVVYRITE